MAKAKLKTIRKKWYDIVAPKDLGEALVGKTYLSEPELAVGRKLKVSYANISGDPQKQNVILKFRISALKDEVLQTELLGLELQASSIKRFVRRGKTRVDDSFLTKTKDNLTVRVKPLLVTKFKASGGVSNSLIKKVKEHVMAEVNKRTLSGLIKDLLSKQFQKDTSSALKKIYPVSIAELRCVEVHSTKKPVQVVEQVTEEQEPAAANA